MEISYYDIMIKKVVSIYFIEIIDIVKIPHWWKFHNCVK